VIERLLEQVKDLQEVPQVFVKKYEQLIDISMPPEDQLVSVHRGGSVAVTRRDMVHFLRNNTPEGITHFKNSLVASALELKHEGTVSATLGQMLERSIARYDRAIDHILEQQEKR